MKGPQKPGANFRVAVLVAALTGCGAQQQGHTEPTERPEPMGEMCLEPPPDEPQPEPCESPEEEALPGESP